MRTTLSLSQDHYGTIDGKDGREGGACFPEDRGSPFTERTFLIHLALLTVMSIVCVILFAFGQNGDEWGVELLVHDGETETLKDFNLWQSISALNDNDRMALVVVLWTTSVIWPYVKLTLNLAVFVMSIRWPQCHRVLGWIEALGKWNHVDVIVCYLIMLSIRVTVDVQTLRLDSLASEFGMGGAELEQDAAQLLHLPLQLQVNGRSGLYMYCTAVCLSMATGHLTTLALWARSQSNIADASSETVHQEAPIQLASRVGVTKMWLVGALQICNVALFVAAISAEFIRISYTLPIVQPDDEYWSVASGITEVLGMHRDRASDRAGDVFLGLLLCVFAILAPGVRLVLQLALWWVPMKAATATRCLCAAQVANLWSGLDVLLLAVGVVSAEMTDLTNGLGREMFDALGLDSLPCHKCVEISLHLASGYWIIVAHCVLSVVVNFSIGAIYEATLEEDGAVEVEIEEVPSWTDSIETKDDGGHRSIII